VNCIIQTDVSHGALNRGGREGCGLDGSGGQRLGVATWRQVTGDNGAAWSDLAVVGGQRAPRRSADHLLVRQITKSGRSDN
jgi:hypothetical protein